MCDTPEAEGRTHKGYSQGLGQLLGIATASFHWSALDTE